MDKEKLQSRFAAMKQDSSSWTAAWRDLATYICPNRGFFSGTPNDGKTFDHRTVIDSTQTRALRTMAAGMTSGLTSPSRPWFKLGIADEELMNKQAVSIWLATVQERMMSVFSKSNIYGALYSMYEEIGTFGTAAMVLLEDYEDVIRARNFTVGEYYLATNSKGLASCFAREYYKTVDQMVEEFGYNNCSESTRTNYDNKNFNVWVKVNHLIEPSREHTSGNLLKKAYNSYYWEEGVSTDKLLSESGFNEFPVLAPRWSVTTTSDIYGRGPSWDCLGDVKMLQKLQKNKLLGLDKTVNPPVQVDSSVIGEPNLLPGGVTRASATVPNVGVRSTYQVAVDLSAIEMTIRESQSAINSTFYKDLFMMISQNNSPTMTAREVVERHEEKLLMLGPVLEKLESELLDPLIGRTFNIMNRVGLIPQPPEELQGMEMKVDYVSVLAQAQKMVGTTAIEQVTRFVMNFAGVNPTVLDVLNPDATATEYARLVGVSPKIIRSPEEIQQLREARAEAQAAAQQAPDLSAAIQGAKNLSETRLDNNSALSALLGR